MTCSCFKTATFTSIVPKGVILGLKILKCIHIKVLYDIQVALKMVQTQSNIF